MRIVSRTLLPHFVFFALLAGGWWLGELSARRIGWFVAVWGVLTAGFRLMAVGSLWLTAAVAVLDVVLILMIFKGDIEIR